MTTPLRVLDLLHDKLAQSEQGGGADPPPSAFSSESAMNRFKRALGVVAIFACVPAARGLLAQDGRNHLYDKWKITVSGAAVFFGSQMRLDPPNGDGTTINVENDLGLASEKLQARAAVRWRMGHRHELELGYLFARRNGEKTITRDLDFADTTFTAGMHLKSVFNADNAFLNYRYAFMARESTQLGAAVGLGALLFRTSLDAEPGSGGVTNEYGQERSVTAPIGSVGLYGRFRIGNAWYFESDLRAIWIGIDRFDAYVADLGGVVRYFPWRDWGFELGYQYNGVRVDVAPVSSRPNSISGRIKYQFQNLRLGVVYTP